jgi:hypothetical protein
MSVGNISKLVQLIAIGGMEFSFPQQQSMTTFFKTTMRPLK